MNNLPDNQLEKLEKSIINKLTSEKKSWTDIYEDLATVNQEQYFKAYGLKNFSSFVNYISREAHCESSYIWRCWRAGKYYSDLIKSPKGLSLETAVQKRGEMIGDEVLILVKQIAKGDHLKAISILEKFCSQEITKKDLVNMIRYSRHQDKDFQDLASEIFLSLEPEVFGLYDSWKNKSGYDKFKLPRGHRSVFQRFPEFAVQPADAKSKIRLDALIATNIDAGPSGCAQDEVILRGIEIKTGTAEALRNARIADFSPFVHEMYLAIPDYSIPDSMEKTIIENLLPGWGLIVYDTERKISTIKVKAAYNPDPPMLFRTLQSLAVKELQTCTFYPSDLKKRMKEEEEKKEDSTL